MALLVKVKGLLPRDRWRRSALAFAAAAFLAFILNLSFILWATANTTVRDGIGTISDRSCASTKAWNTGIHVVINIISTTLLSGSNYCMQRLMAPTRSDIDKAHAKKKWLDVGVPSFRNLRRMTLGRKLLWLLLSISSFPLHLLFNSVVFLSTSTNSYSVHPVNITFLENPLGISYGGPEYVPTLELHAMHAAFRRGELETLTVADCLKAYGTPFQSSRGNLLLVQSTPDIMIHSGPQFYTGGGIGGSRWVCQNIGSQSDCQNGRPYHLPQNFPPNLPQVEGNLKLDNETIRECHGQKTDEHCKLLFSSVLCWIVALFSLLKGCLMLLVAFKRGEKPLLTVGDAVASFLEDEDKHTRSMSLKSKQDFVYKIWDTTPREFKGGSSRKLAWASLSAGAACALLLGLGIYGCLGLLRYGLKYTNESSIWRLGLGALRSNTILNTSFMGQGSRNLLPNVMLANTPQVIASAAYYLYNSLFTSISIATEWDRFGSEPKGLRVSSAPQEEQRETYFLQLPYRYSLPLAGLSACLHWLISQSLFLVSLEVWTTTTSPKLSTVANGEGLISCGWSPLGVLCVVAVIFLMFASLQIVGRRRLRCGVIPVAGSCSAAISAACHPVKAEAWTKPVCWGVVVPAADDVLGHCSFSSGPVGDPVLGLYYA